MIKIQGGALASQVRGLSRSTVLTGEPRSRRITGNEHEDLKHCHEQRKMLLELLSRSLILTEDQVNAAEMILGEAINNAYLHGTCGGNVIIYCLAMTSHFGVILDSPSANCYVGDFTSRVDDFAEHGRGRLIMEAFANDLRKSGLEVSFHYEYKERKNSPGRTILKIEISN